MKPKRCCGTICIHIYRFGVIAWIAFLPGLARAKETQKEGVSYLDKPFLLEASESEVRHSVVKRSGSEVIGGRYRNKPFQVMRMLTLPYVRYSIGRIRIKRQLGQVTYAQQKLDAEQIKKADATLRKIGKFLKEGAIQANTK